MGLSDIDEDDDIPPTTHSPVNATQTAAVPAPAPAPAPAAANAPVDLDDLFGGLGVSSAPPPAKAAAPAAAPAPAPRDDVLDSLFAAPAPAQSPTQSQASASSAPGKGFFVGGGGGNPDDLFDTSKPAQTQRHNDAESFLEAFERQGKGGPSRFAGKNSLENMTRNKDDNMITARLLSLMNYYDVLGVSSTASEEEIKRHYKKKALELHPDRVGHSQTPEEAELFKVITKAHEVLTDSASRLAYDRQLQAGSNYVPGSAEWMSHMQPPA